MKMKKLFGVLAVSVMSMLCILTGCEEETTEDGGEKAGVYYEPIDEKVVRQAYNYGLSAYTYLHYDGRMYTSHDTYDTYGMEKSELEAMMGEELAAVYGNGGQYWSTDKSELAAVTAEAKLYKVKGYDDDFRVCIYVENNIEGDVFYTVWIFDCLNGIYLDKGSDLFTDIIDLSKAVNVTINSVSVSMEEERVQTFLEALNNGTFIDPADEAYPDLTNVCCSEMIFYDEYGLSNAITVYENGYVVKRTNGQETMTIKVNESVCGQIASSWRGIYRADIATNREDDQRESLNIKVEITNTFFDGMDMYNIFVYVKSVNKQIDGEGIAKEEIVLNNEVRVPLELTDNIVFSMKESGFLDNVDESELKDVYVELVRKSGDVIWLRYADSEDELEEQEFMILKRSDY